MRYPLSTLRTMVTGIVSGTKEQLQAMDDAMLESAESSESGLAGAVEEEPVEAHTDGGIQFLPGVETVTGEGNSTEEATAEKKAPEIVLKFRKSLTTYVRVAGIYRLEENEESQKAAE